MKTSGSSVTDPTRTCITHGPIQAGELVHSSCNVVVSRRDGPKVCTCECRACKRAWWAQGRPILRDGKIVRSNND